jgi:hypothetical protein
LSHAIGKPVVLISDALQDVPFDLRPYRVIVYKKKGPKWRDQLGASISRALTAALAKPVDAVPSMFRVPVKSQAPQESEAHIGLSPIKNPAEVLRVKSASSESIPKTAVKPSDGYSVGDRVVHPAYGVGRVLSVDGHGTKLRIRFEKAVEKTILPGYTTLEILAKSRSDDEPSKK